MSLWVVSCFFNTASYQTPLNNFRLFADSLARQGVPLLTVEVAFGDNPFVLPDKYRVIRLRSNSVLWQKERLLNHAVDELPGDCDKVAWVDADILWPDATWAERATDLLSVGYNRCNVVQLFDGALRLFPGQQEWTEKNPWGSGLWWEPGSVFRLQNGRQLAGSAMGFAWAAQREWLECVQLYDRSVLGSGDFILLNALFNSTFKWGHSPLDDDIAAWQTKFSSRLLRPRVGYVAGTICHLFHGNLKNRQYQSRHNILKKHNYLPLLDVVERNHVWEWSSDKPALHQAVRDYFFARKEDEE